MVDWSLVRRIAEAAVRVTTHGQRLEIKKWLKITKIINSLMASELQAFQKPVSNGKYKSHM